MRRAPSPAARSRARSRSSRRPSRWSTTARCARSRLRRRSGSTAWPDVPTFTEQGYKIDQRGFVGLAAPAKTPKPIVDFLSKQLNEVVQSDGVQEAHGGARHGAAAGGRQHAGEVRQRSCATRSRGRASSPSVGAEDRTAEVMASFRMPGRPGSIRSRSCTESGSPPSVRNDAVAATPPWRACLRRCRA